MDSRGSLGRLIGAGLALTITVGVLSSCSGGGGGGSSANVPPALRDALAEIKPVTDVTATDDAQTRILEDEAGLRTQLGANADAVYALLDKARHQEVGSEPPPDLAKFVSTKAFVAGSTPAQLLASVDSFTTILQFSEFFASSLDHLTAGDSGTVTEEFPSRPPQTSDDGTRTVSDTMSQSIGIDVAGSRVTEVLNATLNEKVVDDKTHAVVPQATESRTYRGEINVCPDGGGLVPLTISGQVRLSSPSKTARADSTLDVKGHVNDQAALSAVDASYKNNSKWDAGSVDIDMSNLSMQIRQSSYDPGSLNTDKVTGSVNTTGDAKAGVGWAMTDLALDASVAQPAMAEAQRLWRNGRCVVVAAPDYKAETPIKISEQDSVQHTETVDTSSDTKFTVTVKHRFGSSPPVAPVAVALSGPDKIDPDHLDAAPGSLTYTAPGEEGRSATLTLTSTSKRGIGKLVLRFETKPKKLALSMNGTVSFGFAPVSLTATVHAAQASFKPVGDGTYRATLPATTSYALALTGSNCSGGTGSEGRGSLVFNATPGEGPDKKPIWTVTLDPKRSNVHTNETVCGISFNDVELSGTGGGLAGTVAGVAGTMTFPADGGTVHASRNGVNVTFVATVPK